MPFISSILGVVGGGLIALGWVFQSSGFIAGVPTTATWVFWLLGLGCLIVAAALPWSLISKHLGPVIQLVGFIGICVLALGALIGLVADNSVAPQILIGLGLAGITSACGIYAIPKAKSAGH